MNIFQLSNKSRFCQITNDYLINRWPACVGSQRASFAKQMWMCLFSRCRIKIHEMHFICCHNSKIRNGFANLIYMTPIELSSGKINGELVRGDFELKLGSGKNIWQGPCRPVQTIRHRLPRSLMKNQFSTLIIKFDDYQPTELILTLIFQCPLSKLIGHQELNLQGSTKFSLKFDTQWMALERLEKGKFQISE